MRKKIKELRSEGVEVFSNSKLNAYNQCPMQFYETYEGEKVNRGEQNIYGHMGSVIHDSLEDIVDGKGTIEDMKQNYHNGMKIAQLMGYEFMNQNVENKWTGDIEHLMDNFNLLEGDLISEKGFITQIEGVWLQGYIDIIVDKGDGIIDIYDWKTSSEFRNKDLLRHGRQLVMYKLAMEKEFDVKVDKVAWYMLKYVEAFYNGRSKICNRSSWVKDLSSLIRTQLRGMDYNDRDIEDIISEAISNNNLDNMPEEVQDRFVVEDCIIEYDVTEELIQECKDYIRGTVEAIEDSRKTGIFDACDISKEYFFCNNLCSHGSTCGELAKHKRKRGWS